MSTAGLQKKIGPLPMWAWIVIVGGTIGLYLYKKNSQGSSSSQIDPATGLSYAQEAADQAAGIDPLTGQTYSSETPGGSSGGGGDTSGSTGTQPTDPFSLIDPTTGVTYGSELLAGQASQDPFGQIDPATGQTYGSELTGALGILEKATPTHNASAPKPPKLRGKGSIRAPFGHTRPAEKKGYTIRGLGNGFWEYVPITHRHGSGNAGHAGTTKPTRRTVKLKPAPGGKRSGNYGRLTVPAPTRHSGKKRDHRPHKPGTRLRG